MIEKDISNTEREELINKYKRMHSFVIKTALAENMSDEYIKSKYIEQEVKEKIVFNIDMKNNIKLETLSCSIYRDENMKILMIESKKFKVIY